MNDEELEALLNDLEAGFREDVQAALTLTAQEFADAVEGADELVAARFSVSRIRQMWNRRVPGLLRRLRAIAGRGASVAAEDVGEEAPSADDLDRSGLNNYEKATDALLRAVGDRLAAEATQALADGLNAGEDVSQLQDRLISLFSDTGTQLGPGRAERIAMTETTRAWNAGTLAAAQALTGAERPLVKQWQTRRDNRVREAHADADGQLQLLDDPFDVGGVPMQYPGDPSAPASLTINCRCILRTATAPERTASMADDEFQSRMPAQLKAYWLNGEGAARIRWGTPGSFDRCVRELRDEFPENTEGLCANLHHEATGKWPGEDRASAEVHTGAMVALMPTAEDAARLALDGGESADQLHLTLYYLGEAADWTDEKRRHLIGRMADVARWVQPVPGRVFGGAQWNPDSDAPAWVWNVGDDRDRDGSRLNDAFYEVVYALEDGHTDPELPAQYSPWAPHICAVYGQDDWTQALAGKTGPVTFDRIRVAFAGSYTDIALTGGVPDIEPEPVEVSDLEYKEPPITAPWSTPGGTALAFENQQTGDGRVFAPGALYWDGGPWPLQYADEMNGGHNGAALAGSIQRMYRDGGRIGGAGVLYLTTQAGAESALLMSQAAPIGVSVDLDDVDLEAVDVSSSESYRARLVTASLLPLEGGGWHLTGETEPEWTASSGSATILGESRKVSWTVDADGLVPRSAFDLEAAAGDADVADGTVLDEQRSGDLLMRITRARVRGATLVSIPAFADARIVLDDQALFASDHMKDKTGPDAANNDYERVVRYVRRAATPVAPAELAQKLRITIVAARRYLARAAKRGELVRLTRGTYTGPTQAASVAPAEDHATAGATLTAAATGRVDLPVASQDTEWDGDAAKNRVFVWADGDTDKIAQAFAYREDGADQALKGSYKLGYADVVDGSLTIIPRGASAALAALNGARGGTDVPSDQVSAVRGKLEAVLSHVAEVNGEDERNNMEASAWSALADLPPMPAAWFREPTLEELPPGGPGVNYAAGRIYGWVAQAGEPHAGYAKKVTIDSLGRIDTTHFLRQRFTLDDGSTVKAGAFTMNVGHHRDGAECETASCQFDDTRTVAGIVTVGMNERGMWFSGAAAPWMSEWDRQVFAAVQPSYHMRRGSNGQWQLRAVLSVPVPGHSSPLLASAVIERSQLALTAAATMVEVEGVVAAENARQAAVQPADVASVAPEAEGIDYDRLADAMVAAMQRAEDRKSAEAAELEALIAEAATLDVDTGTESEGGQ